MTSENSTRAAQSRAGRGPGPRRSLAIALLFSLLAIASAWFLVPSAQAYVGQAAQLIQLTGPSATVPCSAVVTVKATVTDATTNQRVPNQFVNWSVKSSPSSADAVHPAQSATDARGRTSTQVTFGQVSGTRKIQAYSADKEFPKTITLSCHADIVTPPPTAHPRPKPTPTKPVPTDQPTGVPTPSSEPGQSIGPIQSPESGQTTQPVQPPPTEPLTSTPAASAAPAGDSFAPPTTTAIVGPGTTPGPIGPTQPTTASPGSGDAIPLIVILLGGLGILGAAALLLWSIARRRSTDGQPPG